MTWMGGIQGKRRNGSLLHLTRSHKRVTQDENANLKNANLKNANQRIVTPWLESARREDIQERR